MKCVVTALSAAAMVASSAHAANVYIDPGSAPWLGYMNVFDLGGGYIYGNGWGVPDLVATFNDGSNTLTVSPNTIGDPDPFWYQGGGGPGAPGNKIMEANLYQQVDDGSLSGQMVTFSGTILSHTYTEAHQAAVFIRDFAPDYSSFTQTFVPVNAAGAFSISLMTDPGAGRHVQWGIQSRGVNVWITDTEPFGNVVFATIPAPGSAALLGLGGAIALRRRRR